MGVTFTASGTFDGANNFNVQLSNASGVFPATPNVIGTAQNNSTAQQTITATIPAGTASGTGYKVRVVSDNPAVTSAASSAFTVTGVSIAPTTTQNILTGANGPALTATEVGAASGRQWVVGPSATGPFTAISGQTGTSYNPNFATAGTYYVAVQSTFGCGTLTSNAVQVNVTDPIPTPTITSFTPANGVVGTPVTITGTNFVNVSGVTFNGTTAPGYTVNSATSITVNVPTAATTGPIAVTTASGTATSATSFTVDNPVPTITTLAPGSKPAGAPAFTLTVTGTNFLSSSVVSFNGTALTTTFVSSTQLTAAVPASAVATVGSYDVTVTNPAPGGGTSAPAAFAVTSGGGMETFANLNTSGSSYLTGSYVGDNAVTWNYVNVRGDITLNGKAATLQGNNAAAIYSNPVSGGLSALTFSYQKAFSGAVSAVVSVNGQQVGTISTNATAVQTFSVSGLTFAGNVEIRVQNTATGNQVTLDDISWTGYTPTGPEITVTQSPANSNVNTGATVSVASTAVGSSTDVSFTIINDGVQPLTLGTISAANAEFTLTGTDPSNTSLAANGGTATITVRFAPAAAGTRTGAISIPNNDVTGSEDPFVINFTGTGTATYYAKATGDLSDLATYGLNTDGSGAAPASFAADGQVLTVTGTGRTLGANLTVAGTGSKLVLGPNAELIIPAGFNYTGPLDLGAGSTLTMQNPTVAYTLGSIDATSTIDYAQTGNFVVPALTYGNLKLTNGTKTLAGNTTTVRGNFTVADVTNFGGQGSSPFSVLRLLGDFTAQGTVTAAPLTNGYTLQLDGTTAQTLTGNGNVISLYRLLNNNTAGAVLSAAGGSSLSLGNAASGSNGGGLVQSANTTLTLNSNTVTLVANGTFSGTGTFIGATTGTLNVAKTATTDPGTVYFGPGETLGTLTLNATGTGDELTLGSSVTVNNLNLTDGVLALGGQSLTLNGPVTTTAAGQLRGSAASVLRFTGSGSIGALDFVNGSATLNTLTLDRTANTAVPLGDVLTVGTANLTRGSLSFTPTTRLVVTGTLTGGSADSYVNALTLPTGTSTTTATLTYPLGGALGFYRPVVLSLTQSTSTSNTAYTARIVEQSANGRGATAPLTKVSAIRYFSLNKETGGATFGGGTLTLSFGTDDGVNDQGTLRVAASTGSGAFADMGAPTISGSFPAAGFATGTIAVGLTALPADVALATTANDLSLNPLPVTLVAFTARQQGEGALLRWTTAQEKNNARFEVQRSPDGVDFQPIGTVAGAGTSTTARAYSYLDTRLPAGTVYYRLRQVDIDGTAMLSPVVTLGKALVQLLTLYPNPVRNQLHLAGAEGPVQWRIVDMLGRPVREGSHVGPGAIDVSSLRPGSYQVTLTVNGVQSKHRLVRQD